MCVCLFSVSFDFYLDDALICMLESFVFLVFRTFLIIERFLFYFWSKAALGMLWLYENAHSLSLDFSLYFSSFCSLRRFLGWSTFLVFSTISHLSADFTHTHTHIHNTLTLNTHTHTFGNFDIFKQSNQLQLNVCHTIFETGNIVNIARLRFRASFQCWSNLLVHSLSRFAGWIYFGLQLKFDRKSYSLFSCRACVFRVFLQFAQSSCDYFNRFSSKY